MPTDESSIGVILFVVLVTSIVAQVVAYDLWLHAHGHELLTTEFREGLRNPVYGSLLVFFTAGSFAWFIWHMAQKP